MNNKQWILNNPDFGETDTTEKTTESSKFISFVFVI